MHECYRSTANKISEWAAADADGRGIVLIGSQVRKEDEGDRWSDLDVLIFTGAPAKLGDGSGWLGHFGRPVCITKEVVRIDSMNLEWFVKRPLYDDFRAVDFSILPYGRMGEAVELNKATHYCGYEVIHDDGAGSLEASIEKSLRDMTPPRYAVPDESEFNDLGQRSPVPRDLGVSEDQAQGAMDRRQLHELLHERPSFAADRDAQRGVLREQRCALL